jgi:hypothetical protein
MKKYVLAYPLLDHDQGEPLTLQTKEENGMQDRLLTISKKNWQSVTVFYDIQAAIDAGWVKEVEEKITLYRDITKNYHFVAKQNDTQFTEQECTLMEKALNGELLDIDLAVFTDWVFDAEPGNMTHSELLEAFNDRHRR